MASPFEDERARLLDSQSDPEPNPQEVSPFQQERARLLAGPTAFEVERDRLSRGAEEETGGFFQEIASTFRTLSSAAEEGFGDPLNPKSVARRQALASGILEGAVVKPAEAVSQIPGLLGFDFGEKTTDFLQRTRIGMHSKAEKAGLEAGITEEEIAAFYGTGDFIGFVAPVSASVKAASFLLRAPLLLSAGTGVRAAAPTITGHLLAGNLVTDMTAGAIYGGIFKPADSLNDRVVNLASESAAFGVMRIGINVLAQPMIAFRNNRTSALERVAKVDDILESYRNGEPVVVETGEQSLALSRLLSEESYVTNSSAAQEILTRFQDESALIQGIITSGEAGQTSGFVEGLTGNFQQVTNLTDRLKVQFPNLKFDTVRRPRGLSVHFGSKNLSNTAKAQLKIEGRIVGQRVEKNGIQYEYVRAEGDHLIVRTTDTKKPTKIKNENISDALNVREEIEVVGPAEALYQDFSTKLASGIEGLNVEGVIPESELIRLMRTGELSLSNEVRRPFDIGGGVTYPEELGKGQFLSNPIEQDLLSHVKVLVPASEVTAAPRAFRVTREVTPEVGIEWVITPEAGGKPVSPGSGLPVDISIARDPADVAIGLGKRRGYLTLEEAMAKLPSESRPIEAVPAIESAENITDLLLREGTGEVFVLEPPSVMSFESLVEQWAVNAELPANAPDIQALKGYFGQRARNDFWGSVSKEDMSILNKIKAEQHALVEAGEIPFNAYAHNKGFSVERNSGDTVTLRDLLTGRRVTFGSERVAVDALNGTIRPEGDILGGSLLPAGTHGVGGFTGGFRPSDGVFTFDGKVPTREFIRDVPLTSGIQNNRDMFSRIEGQTGIPIFSEVFNLLDMGLTAQRNFVEPWAKKIQQTWKGIKAVDRVEVAEFWRKIEGLNITPAKELSLAKAAGLSKNQIRAFRESRDFFDVWGGMAGLRERNQWIQGYYGRIRPYAESTGGNVRLAEIFGDELSVPPEFKFFAEQHRVGDLPMVEMDPEIVMHKYVRSLGFKLHTEEVYNRARGLVSKKTTPKIGDLPPAQASNLLRQARFVDPTVNQNTPILPPSVRRTLSEYLNTVRGNPTTSEGTMRRWGKTFFDKIGIRTDERVLDQYVNNGLSMMYGSAMGLKPSLWARNATQTVWMSYTRMGGEHGGSSLKKALTTEGWQEVVDIGAIRNVEAGLPAADAMFTSMIESNAIEASTRNPVTIGIASAMRAGLRLGEVGSNVAKKMLIPYSDQDALNRAWSYFWQKEFTAKHLERYETRSIDWDTFRKDGLPFFHQVIKDEFASRYNAFGKEDALRWIGKQGADEAQFIYGVGAQPAWMQKPVGRFLGMFGTWPMWAIETYFRRTKNATPLQTTALYARTLALTGAFANMSIQTGIDMWGWIAPASIFGWSGGPAVDYTIQLKRAYDAPLDQKVDALNMLANGVGRMSLPGQGFVRDLRRNLNATNLAEGALQMMLGRPIDDYNYGMEFLYDPDFHTGYDLTPQAESGIRSLRGLEDFPNFPIQQLTSPVSR